MEASLSPDERLDAPEAELLLAIAEAAIVEGFQGRSPALPDLANLPPALRQPRGLFVTLTVDGALNGCIGTVDADEPLGYAVAHYAQAAAFADPRLPRLRPSDHDRLAIEVSVLSPLTELDVTGRDELLAELRPWVDGLVLTVGAERAVFLPAVWEKLTDPEQFLAHLEAKAGLRSGSWPAGLRALRFSAERYRAA
jgi:AmmeMemoRadiSam system protein A